MAECHLRGTLTAGWEPVAYSNRKQMTPQPLPFQFLVFTDCFHLGTDLMGNSPPWTWSFNILSFGSWHSSIPPHFFLTCQVSLADLISKDFNKEFLPLNTSYHVDKEDTDFYSLHFLPDDWPPRRQSATTPITENWPGMLKHAFLFSLLLSAVFPWITMNTGGVSLQLFPPRRFHCQLLMPFLLQLIQVSLCRVHSLSASHRGRYCTNIISAPHPNSFIDILLASVRKSSKRKCSVQFGVTLGTQFKRKMSTVKA